MCVGVLMHAYVLCSVAWCRYPFPAGNEVSAICLYYSTYAYSVLTVFSGAYSCERWQTSRETRGVTRNSGSRGNNVTTSRDFVI